MSFSNKKFAVYLIIISLLFLLGLYCGLRFGAISYSQQELLTTLLHPFKETATQDILIDLRLPRVLAAGLVGAAMATAGAIMQGLMRNAIADPGLLGINAGAGLALALGYLFFKSLHYSMILLPCLLGATVAAFLVLVLIVSSPDRIFSAVSFVSWCDGLGFVHRFRTGTSHIF